MPFSSHVTVCSISSARRGLERTKPTLHGSLGTDGRGQTEGSGHEVGEDLVGAGRLVGGVFAEIGDLQGRGVLLRAAEGAVEGRLVRDVPPLAGGDRGPSGGQLLTSAGAQQSGGGSGERHGGEWERQLTRGNEQLRGRGEVGVE